MRVGMEGTHFFDSRKVGPFRVLEQTAELGLDGVFFKSMLDLSGTLDRGELEAVRQRADELGLYLESGVGLVNPYGLAEKPKIREFGGGDTRRAFERMIEAASWIGCTDLLAVTGQWKPGLPEPYSTDRFRTDVTWEEQLRATERFLSSLAPVLREHGVRISVETHEEITSFEVARIIETVGPDVVSATLDIGNVLARAENPVESARRLAPYVRLVHAKDAVMLRRPFGLVRQLRSCGLGVVDWETLLTVLHAERPDVNLSIEDNQGDLELFTNDPAWLAAHPDLGADELASVVAMADRSEEKIARGEWLDHDSYDARPWEDVMVERLTQSRDHLRATVTRLGFDGPRASAA